MSETVPVVRGDELVEKVARACANDQSARAIACKGGSAAFDEMEDETEDFWRCIAHAALSVAIEEAARVALSYETKDWASYDPRTIASAIRALGRGEGE